MTKKTDQLDTPTKRSRLEPRHRAYWTTLVRGTQLGYRRASRDKPGTWYARTFVSKEHGYATWRVGAADDPGLTANGTTVLAHKQAVDAALNGKPAAPPVGGPRDPARFTVADAVREYVEQLRSDGKSTAIGLDAYVVKTSKLAPVALARLTHEDLMRWRTWAVAYRPAGRRDWSRYLRLAASRAELERRYKEAREQLNGGLPNAVVAAHERRSKELAGVVKVRRHGPAPKRPRPPAPAVDPADAERRRKETVNRIINSLKACLNLAHANGRVGSRAAWERLQRFGGTGSARVRWLTLDEATRLLNGAPPWFRPMIEAGLATGARWSELAAARVQDFDGRAGTLLIPRSKSGKARHVPLNDEGKAMFERLAAGRGPTAPLLPKPDGSRYSKSDQHRPMRAAVAAARLTGAVTFHVLRHTYASHLVQAGAPLITVAAALGHSGTRMVEQHYGHLAPTSVASVVREHLPTFGLTTKTNVRRLRL